MEACPMTGLNRRLPMPMFGLFRKGLVTFSALLVLLPTSLAAAEIGHGVDGAGLSPLWVLPFAGMLLSVALLPLLAPEIWHHHYGKVSLFWDVAMVLPLAAILELMPFRSGFCTFCWNMPFHHPNWGTFHHRRAHSRQRQPAWTAWGQYDLSRHRKADGRPGRHDDAAGDLRRGCLHGSQYLFRQCAELYGEVYCRTSRGAHAELLRIYGVVRPISASEFCPYYHRVFHMRENGL
jgi:hypothetical protein